MIVLVFDQLTKNTCHNAVMNAVKKNDWLRINQLEGVHRRCDLPLKINLSILF